MERVMGFEPTTPCLGSKYSTAELHPPMCIYFSLKTDPCKEVELTHKSCPRCMQTASLTDAKEGLVRRTRVTTVRMVTIFSQRITLDTCGAEMVNLLA
jgi:hypothetical protein